MAYSYAVYMVTNPSVNDFVVPCPYLSRAHIKVALNGVDVAFTFLTDGTIEVGPAMSVGDAVRVYRQTPKVGPLVSFQGGAAVTKANLDKMQTQMLYITQESVDAMTATLQQDLTGNFDALSARIINVAAPVDPQDAVTKVYADAEKVQAAASAAAAEVSRLASEAARDTSIAAKDESVSAAAASEVSRAASVVAKDGAETAYTNTVAALDTKVDKSLFTAAWDVLVGSSASTAIKKTFAEFWAYLVAFAVGGWTKQQYAPPVAVTPTTGAVTLDAQLHQNCKISSTQNLTMNAPTNAVEGMMLFVNLYAATALTITWNAVFVKNADKDLPTAHTAGKDMFLQFYFDGANWVLLGGCERA